MTSEPLTVEELEREKLAEWERFLVGQNAQYDWPDHHGLYTEAALYHIADAWAEKQAASHSRQLWLDRSDEISQANALKAKLLIGEAWTAVEKAFVLLVPSAQKKADYESENGVSNKGINDIDARSERQLVDSICDQLGGLGHFNDSWRKQLAKQVVDWASQRELQLWLEAAEMMCEYCAGGDVPELWPSDRYFYHFPGTPSEIGCTGSRLRAKAESTPKPSPALPREET